MLFNGNPVFQTDIQSNVGMFLDNKDKKCLRLVRSDKLLSYEELLGKDGTVSVHHENIQSLAIEMLQIKHCQSREIVTDISTQVTQEQNFRKNRDCRIPSVNTVFHASESTSY